MRSRRVTKSTADRVGWDVWVGSSVDERTINTHAITMRLEFWLPQGKSVGCYSRGSLRRISSRLLHFSNLHCRAPRYARAGLGAAHMFDVYLSDRRDHLLVVEKGQPFPIDQHLGRWHKKRAAVAVSDEIRTAVQRDGYYSRRLREPPGAPARSNAGPI